MGHRSRVIGHQIVLGQEILVSAEHVHHRIRRLSVKDMGVLGLAMLALARIFHQYLLKIRRRPVVVEKDVHGMELLVSVPAEIILLKPQHQPVIEPLVVVGWGQGVAVETQPILLV